MQQTIVRSNNKISVHGDLQRTDLSPLFAAIYQCYRRVGYAEIVLDFSACTAALSREMLGLIGYCLQAREETVDFRLVLPSKHSLRQLFLNANWAHLLDPRQAASLYVPGARMPAVQFRDLEDQRRVVDQLLDSLLGAVTFESRSSLSVVDWVLSEVTENVIRHADSMIGGLAQFNLYDDGDRCEYVVVDAGRGIPASLRTRFASVDDTTALKMAIQEEVTRDPSEGQGNGLYGSSQVSRGTNSSFYIRSGTAKLEIRPGSNTESADITKVPYDGTIVAAQIDLSRPEILRNALAFKRGVYEPYDTIERLYQAVNEEQDVSRLRLSEHRDELRHRKGGRVVAQRIENLARLSGVVVVDCSDVRIATSSFADEALGKLLVRSDLAGRVKLENVGPDLRVVIDRAIAMRSGTVRESSREIVASTELTDGAAQHGASADGASRRS